MDFVSAFGTMGLSKGDFDVDVFECLELMTHPEQASSKAKSLKEEGNQLFRNQRFAEAASLYAKAGQFWNVCVPLGEEEEKKHYALGTSLLLNLAACSLKSEDFHNTIRLCGDALSIDPCNVKALFRRAVAFNKIGRCDKAMKDLKQALVIDPDNHELLLEMQKVKNKAQVQHCESSLMESHSPRGDIKHLKDKRMEVTANASEGGRPENVQPNGASCNEDVASSSTVSTVCMEESSLDLEHEQLSRESLSSYSLTRSQESLLNTMPSAEDRTKVCPTESPAKTSHSRGNAPRCTKKLKFSKKGVQNHYLSLSHHMYERVLAGKCLEVYNPVTLSYMTVRKVSPQQLCQNDFSIKSAPESVPQLLAHDALSQQGSQQGSESSKEGEDSEMTSIIDHNDREVESGYPGTLQPSLVKGPKRSRKLKKHPYMPPTSGGGRRRKRKSSRKLVRNDLGFPAKRKHRKLVLGDVQDRQKRSKICSSVDYVCDNFPIFAGGCDSQGAIVSPTWNFVVKGSRQEVHRAHCPATFVIGRETSSRPPCF